MSHEFTLLPPEHDGFRKALKAARRRRYRTMSLTTGTAGVGAALLVALLVQPGTASLSQDDPVLNDPDVPAVTVTSSPVPNEPHVVAGTQLGSTGGAASGQPPGPSAAPDGSDRAQSATSAGDRPGAVRAPYRAGPMTKDENALAVPDCIVPSGQLCLTAYIDINNRMQSAVCSASAGSVTLRFPDARETDFAVLTADGRTTLWRWSASNPPTGGSHSSVLDSGRCSYWYFPWTGVDGRGAALAGGDYLLRATSFARELRGEVSDYPFSLP